MSFPSEKKITLITCWLNVSLKFKVNLRFLNVFKKNQNENKKEINATWEIYNILSNIMKIKIASHFVNFTYVLFLWQCNA